MQTFSRTSSTKKYKMCCGKRHRKIACYEQPSANDNQSQNLRVKTSQGQTNSLFDINTRVFSIYYC